MADVLPRLSTTPRSASSLAFQTSGHSYAALPPGSENWPPQVSGRRRTREPWTHRTNTSFGSRRLRRGEGLVKGVDGAEARLATGESPPRLRFTQNTSPIQVGQSPPLDAAIETYELSLGIPAWGWRSAGALPRHALLNPRIPPTCIDRLALLQLVG